MEWRREPVDVAEVIARATAATAALFGRPGLELVVDVAPGLPTRRSAIAIGSIQVVINLISNAVKFTPSGSDHGARRAARRRRRRVVVSVTDTGIGIAPEDHAARLRAVRPGRRHAHRQAARDRAWACAICREIVEHHGGRLWLESEVGRRVDVLVQPAGGLGLGVGRRAKPVLILVLAPWGQEDPGNVAREDAEQPDAPDQQQCPDDAATHRDRVLVAVADRRHRHDRPPDGVAAGLDVGVRRSALGTDDEDAPDLDDRDHEERREQ